MFYPIIKIMAYRLATTTQNTYPDCDQSRSISNTYTCLGNTQPSQWTMDYWQLYQLPLLIFAYAS